jgi:hypothetical protein
MANLIFKPIYPDAKLAEGSDAVLVGKISQIFTAQADADIAAAEAAKNIAVTKAGEASASALTAQTAKNATEVLKTETQSIIDSGIHDGKSAYQLWLDQGGVGTVADYQLSLRGAKGDKGDTGATGTQGLQGLIGVTGPQGIKGDRGDKGDTGNTGPQGIQGLKGDTGNTGQQGIQGPQGLKGDTGNTGATGAAGIADNLTIGTISTGAAGSSALATISGTTPNKVLNLTIPRGDNGVIDTTSYVNVRNLFNGIVKNGSLQDGTNSLFPTLSIENETPPGHNKSFLKAGLSTVLQGFNQSNDEKIAINPDLVYVVSLLYKQRSFSAANSVRHFFGAQEYDTDGLLITYSMCTRFINCDTTLAADLSVGDTTITLTSAANWLSNSDPTYLRGIVFIHIKIQKDFYIKEMRFHIQDITKLIYGLMMVLSAMLSL